MRIYRNYSCLFFALLFSCACLSQDSIVKVHFTSVSKDTMLAPSIPTIQDVDSAPSFIGGQEKLYDYLFNEIKYPEEAMDKNIQGTVYVNFIIDTSGNVLYTKALNEIGGGCEAEAVRIVQGTSGKWIPGTLDGKKVEVSMLLPIKYTIQDGFDSSLKKYPGKTYHVTNPDLLIESLNHQAASKYYEKGVQAFNAGNIEESIVHFDKATDLNPCDIDAWYNMAIAKGKLGNKEGACLALKRGKKCGDKEAKALWEELCKD